MPHLTLNSTSNNIWTYSLIELKKNKLFFKTEIVGIETSDFYIFKRYVFSVERTDIDQYIHYQISINTTDPTDPTNQTNPSDPTNIERLEYKITIPGKHTKLNILYTSCNQYYQEGVWDSIYEQHITNPYHLNICGGDQIYEKNKVYPHGLFNLDIYKEWLSKPIVDRYNMEFTEQMKKETYDFYYQTYIAKFFDSIEYKYILPNIPCISMWDDHDIFDGYGSYPPDIQNSPIIKNIYLIAKECFLIFQKHHMTFAYNDKEKFANYNMTSYYEIDDILLINIDTRSNRTINQILNNQTYQTIYEKLRKTTKKHIILNISSPIIFFDETQIKSVLSNDNFDIYKPSEYNKFPIFKTYYNMFGIPDLNDDFVDQWSHSNHIFERDLFILELFRILEDDQTKNKHIHIISGDVHCGGYGYIKYKDYKIEQYISSGVGSKGPPKFMMKILKSKSDHIEYGKIRDESLTYIFESKSIKYNFNWLQIHISDILNFIHYEFISNANSDINPVKTTFYDQTIQIQQYENKKKRSNIRKQSSTDNMCLIM